MCFSISSTPCPAKSNRTHTAFRNYYMCVCLYVGLCDEDIYMCDTRENCKTYSYRDGWLGWGRDSRSGHGPGGGTGKTVFGFFFFCFPRWLNEETLGKWDVSVDLLLPSILYDPSTLHLIYFRVVRTQGRRGGPPCALYPAFRLPPEHHKSFAFCEFTVRHRIVRYTCTKYVGLLFQCCFNFNCSLQLTFT